jgi:hypothetical protein
MLHAWELRASGARDTDALEILQTAAVISKNTDEIETLTSCVQLLSAYRAELVFLEYSGNTMDRKYVSTDAIMQFSAGTIDKLTLYVNRTGVATAVVVNSSRSE